MKARIKGITTLLIVSITIFGQQIDSGNYRLCFDKYWRCHFQLLIELREDSTYTFEYRDDTRRESTTGKWKFEPYYLVMTPDFIPDSIKVTEVFEYEKNDITENLIWIVENFKGVDKVPVDIYRNGIKNHFMTDETGEIKYNGQIADSISFPIKGHKLTVIPKRKKSTLIKITLDTNYKDLIYRQLGINKIMIINGKMLLKYKDADDETGQTKTEYFEKIN